MKKSKTYESNMIKIQNLKNALEAIGIDCEIWEDAKWYGIDYKTHCGIELSTDFDCGEDCLSFIFDPNGNHIYSCLEAPLEKN